MWWYAENGTYDQWFYCIISMVLVIDDRWCGNKKDVSETSRIWWKDKEDVFVSDVNIEGRNISKYENNSGT